VYALLKNDINKNPEAFDIKKLLQRFSKAVRHLWDGSPKWL